jgi:hypothetical protein
MTDVNAFIKRALLAASISVLPLANTASAHGGGHGSGGSGGSSGSSGGSSSGGGHSSSGSNGGHSSGGHSSSSTSGGHAAAASKAGHTAADPSNVSQSVTTGQGMHSGKVHRAFVQQGRSTGYNQQNTETNQDDWRRRHPHLLFGFIRY